MLDVGSGTGVLAMMMAKNGAARVHAVEASSMADATVRIMEDNGLHDRVTVHKTKIEDLQLEGKVC